MKSRIFAGLCALAIAAACAPLGSDVVVVRGVGSGDLLNVRAGPSLGYRVVRGFPDGTELIRGPCVTELGQLWCEVSPLGAPQLTGYASADYLAER